MAELACTPGQTVGPYFASARCRTRATTNWSAIEHAGAIRLHGTVYDGAGDAVPDALIELWQPGPDGRLVRKARLAAARRQRRSPAGADAQPTPPATTASAR